MNVNTSPPPTQALRIVPGVPYVFFASATDRSPPRSPPKSWAWCIELMVTVLAHRLVGGLRLSAKRPTATATRIAPGNNASPNERTAKKHDAENAKMK